MQPRSAQNLPAPHPPSVPTPRHDWLAIDQSQCITVSINTVLLWSRVDRNVAENVGNVAEAAVQEMGGGMLGIDELVLLPDVKYPATPGPTWQQYLYHYS